MIKNYALSAILALSVTLDVVAADYVPSYKLIDTPEYYSEDLAVATFNVLDYGIDNTGSTDCTSAVQKLLDACAGVGVVSNTRGDYRNPTGGIVYFPAGQYLFTGQLTIPRGVTIRGDWQRPVEGEKLKGTVFAVKPLRGKGVTAPSYAFITMQPSTLISGVAFWYPDQNPASISKYPATVLYGQNSYWGNDYCNVRHCTFVNSYIAVQFNPNNGGGCPNIFDIYGTPLYEGIEMDCIADVGRFDGINFAASYWEDCGFPSAPQPGQIDDWLYENATAIAMRRNDWSYTCNLSVCGYKVGFHAEASPVDGRPNGHNYGFELENCKTGILISSVSGSGIMFTNVSTPDCETGVSLLPGADGPVQFYGCRIDGKAAAIDMDEDATSSLMFQDCDVTGATIVNGGHFQAVNNTFSSNVGISAKARTIFTDNKFKNSASLSNNSIFKCVVENSTGYSYPKLPSFGRDMMEIRQTYPARHALYVVTADEFGAKPYTDVSLDPSTQTDCAGAIQKALDKAKADGGGIVYLPVGHYPCKNSLVIPEGVEFKGAGDIPTVPKNNGAVLEVLVGEGNENGAPFITMSKACGLRGITINYPAQKDPKNITPYPYSVRGNADCYIVNMAVRAAYRGLDLFTNKCDRHYVDYLAGHAFMNVVRIGGNSEDGIFANTQCNTIAYACGDESKFGSWPNSLAMADYTVQQQAYCQNERDLEFMIVGDCKREFLYNNFLFGCNKGMWFVSDNNGGAVDCRSLGNAVDGAIQTFVIDGIGSDLNLVNSQIVALDHDPSDNKHRVEISKYIPAYFIRTGDGVSGKTVNFLSSNNWGGGDYMTDIKTGTVNIAMTNMNASGEISTFNVAGGAKINVFNGRFNGMKKTLGSLSDASRTSVVSSVIEYKSGNIPAELVWENNLLPTWEFENTSDLESRSGWTATASDNNGNARRAIDGVSSTRWDTGGPQTKGQWFAVNFNKSLTFNTVILDASPSGNSDGPAAYTIEVYTEGQWKEVATGKNAGATCVITFAPETASQVRVTQTGSKSNYWSIHEFYIGNLEMSGIEDVLNDSDAKLSFDGNGILVDADCIDNAMLEIYDLNGVLAYSTRIVDTRTDVSSLAQGVYIALVRSSKGSSTLKFSKRM
ncbi:MAG: T9SS type A sorting domain-containing protein [Bacteroides sp.]|nr:T9SS type A sorting domain-containing protein [Bacteroides sp.]